MKKTLVIVAHPDIARSTVNRTWAHTLAAQESRYTVRELYATYPDGKINVAAEQALIEAHGSVILQFPVYWFSCPPLLKQWTAYSRTAGRSVRPLPRSKAANWVWPYRTARRRKTIRTRAKSATR